MMVSCCVVSILIHFFFFTDTSTSEIYTLSLHDALPIFQVVPARVVWTMAGLLAVLAAVFVWTDQDRWSAPIDGIVRSEEHTSELQSHSDLVCRLLLEKKKNENIR